MAKKLKRFVVYKRTKSGKLKTLGQELAYSKANANKKVKKMWGKSAFVRQIKY